MKYEAVIFDLFGTLVNSFGTPEYGTVLAEMSSLLSVPHDEFLRLWSETSKPRFTGTFTSIEANLKHICRELNVQVTDAQVEEAARVRSVFAARSMELKPYSLEVASNLKSQGFKLALISNCGFETPAIWGDLPFAGLFDTTVFSCEAGMTKPDPDIYRLALGRLAVKPERCLYIGDRADTDMLGAANMGIHPVLIRGTEARAGQWNGLIIDSLKEVLELVK